jgi:hypothetical protein
MKLVDVINSLKTEERRRNEMKQDVKTAENEQAFNTKTRHFSRYKIFNRYKMFQLLLDLTLCK